MQINFYYIQTTYYDRHKKEKFFANTAIFSSGEFFFDPQILRNRGLSWAEEETCSWTLVGGQSTNPIVRP